MTSKNGSNGAIGTPVKREYLDVVVTDVNPATGAFSYQVVGDSIKQLERLMAEIQTAYASNASGAPAVKVGDLVAAKFSEDDTWYRARVKRVDRTAGKAEVQYIDYGNAELIALTRLRTLDAKFTSLPPQAKEAKLSFVQFPTSEEYLADAVYAFQNLVADRQLVASIDRREGGGLSLSLYDPVTTEADPNESVNAVLVSAGAVTVLPAKQATWEASLYATTLASLRARQADAQKRRLGMFEFGDSTGYDE
ncbi:MAG: hypothetical protein EOO77_44395 [Oxalobacteraceae bacterium]|nr:MAG: hypothetical protein EOO77_44395 [Oxalobacteraceae bacterium]